MPSYTIQDIENLAKQNLITPQERTLLRQDLYQQANQEEGALRKMVTHLSHEVTEGWKHLSAGAVTTATAATSEKTKTEKALAPIEAIAGALQILSSISTAAGHTAGETVQDFLLKRGANANVAALAATIADVTIQAGPIIYKGAQAAKSIATTSYTGVTKASKETTKVVTSEQVKKAIVEWIEEKQNPANLVDIVRKPGGQDVPLAKGAGVIQGERKALPSPTKQLSPPSIKLGPPPDTEKAGKLIDEALQSGEPLDLGALQQAIQAPNPVQAIVQGLHRSAPANGAVKELDKTIPVFHGTKHQFEQFDVSKIGTGEGAQVYGHGLYFAESPSVAEQYRKAATQTAPGNFQGGAQYSVKGTEFPKGRSGHMALDTANNIESYLAYKKMGSKEMMEVVENQIENRVGRWLKQTEPGQEKAGSANEHMSELVDYWQRIKTAKPDEIVENAGALYSAKIPESLTNKMLDWDKPLSEQAPEVQKALKKLGIEAKTSKDTGADLYYSAMWDKSAAATGNDRAQEASRLLNKAGIPGIKYLDQGSRTAGEGTRNFVVFDPKILEGTKNLGAGEKAVEVAQQIQKAGPQAKEAAPKVLKLTPGDTLDMKRAMEKETDPYTLFSMATEQSTPRDIRQVAANRLNEVNPKDLSHFLLNEADPDFLKRISRSGMLPTTYTQFAKDKLKTLERAGLVGGGLDESRAGDIGAMATARLKFAEGMEKYEAGRINLKELHAEAQKSQMSMNDVLTLKPGVPKTPLEVAEISKPVRDFGESFIKNVDQAEAGIAKGDYGKFWEALSDFHLMVEAHWPYMYPRQVAGQTLKTYDEPVLSATHFLQQIPKFSSWLAKLNLSDANEIEAAAPLIMREMQKIKAPGELSNFAKRIATETAEKGDEVLKDPTWRDKASFYFINSLMSGTDTIGRNLAGNTLAVPWHYAEKMTSTAASKVINPFLSAEHKLDAGNFSDANAAMGIWFRTMWDASRYTLTRKFDAMKGLVPDEAARAELLGNRFDLPRFSTTGTTNPIGGMAGKIIGTPVSIAQTADEVSRFAAYRMAIGEKLHQEWVGSGSKVPWRQYFDEGLDNTPPTVHEYGIRIANELTFSDQMSALGKVAMNARQNLPGTEFIVPFIKTTDRLTAYQYNRTPGLNLFSTRLRDELMSGDNAVKAEALGRVFLSGVMGAGIFAATRSDAPDGLPLITGGGPTDRKLMMKLKDANVLQPYTIWTPAGRFNYGYLAPMRGPMGMIADASEIWDEIKNPEEVTSLWSGILLAGTRNFFDMSYTKQFADLMDMWDKPTSSSTNAFQRAGANLVKGFVEPSIVRQVLRTIDPSTKETHGFIDELARDVPGWGLPSRKNPLTGEPVLNPPRMLADVPGLNWFLPTSPIQPATDAFANKVRELGWRPPDLPKSFAGQSASESPFAYSGALGEAQEAASGVPIPRDLYPKRDQYIYGAEDTGQTLNDEAQKLVSDPEFSKLAPIDQADQLNALYRSRFSGAIERLKSEHPELTDAYELKMQTRAAVRMPPEEREAFQMTEEAPPDVPTPNFMPPEEAAPE